MTKYERIDEILKTLDDEAIRTVHNGYCEDNHDDAGYIYSMSDFDEVFYGYTPTDLAFRLLYGSDEGRAESTFNPSRKYFYLEAGENPISFSYIGYRGILGRYACDIIDEDAITAYIVTWDKDYGIAEIREALDEDEGTELDLAREAAFAEIYG